MWGRVDIVEVAPEILTYAEVGTFYLAGVGAFLIVAGRRWIRGADPWEAALTAMPAVMIVVHLLTSAFVNMVPGRLEYFSLPLIALAWGAAWSEAVPRRAAGHVLLAGTLLAALLARDPMVFGQLTIAEGLVIRWSSLSVTLLVGAACEFAAAAFERDVVAAAYGVMLSVLFASTGDVYRLQSYVPDDREGWGGVLIVAAFGLLAMAIARTLKGGIRVAAEGGREGAGEGRRA